MTWLKIALFFQSVRSRYGSGVTEVREIFVCLFNFSFSFFLMAFWLTDWSPGLCAWGLSSPLWLTMCTSDSLRCFTVKKKGLKFNVIFKDKPPSRLLGGSFNATMTLSYHSEHFFTRARWLQKDMYTYIGKIVIEELQKWGRRSHPERQYATVEECSALKIRIEREQRKHCAIRNKISFILM